MDKKLRMIDSQNVLLRNTTEEYVDGLAPKGIKIVPMDIWVNVSDETKTEMESLGIQIIEQSEREIDNDTVDIEKIEKVLEDNGINFVKDGNVERYVDMYLSNYIEDEDIYISKERIVEEKINDIEKERQEKLSSYQRNELVDAMAQAVYALAKDLAEAKKFFEWMDGVKKINEDADKAIAKLRKTLNS